MQTVGVSTRRLRGCTGARHCFMFLSKCNIHVRFKKKKGLCSFLSSEQQDVFTRNKSKVICVAKAVLKEYLLNIRLSLVC